MTHQRTNKLKHPLAVILCAAIILSSMAALACSPFPLEQQPILKLEQQGETPPCLPQAEFLERSIYSSSDQEWWQYLTVRDCEVNLILNIEDKLRIGIANSGEIYNLNTMAPLKIAEHESFSAYGTFVVPPKDGKPGHTKSPNYLTITLNDQAPKRALRWRTTDSASEDLNERFAPQSGSEWQTIELLSEWGEKPMSYGGCPEPEELSCVGCNSTSSSTNFNGFILLLLLGTWMRRRLKKPRHASQ